MGNDSRILVGLSTPEERQTAAETLEARGYDLAVVSSVELLMALREALPFDLMVVDSAMATRYRSHSGYRIPTLLVSDDAEGADPSQDLHVDDFIIRPLGAAELARRAAALIAGSQVRVEGELAGPAGMVVKPDSRELIIGHDSIQLRPREARVLSLLLGRRGEVVKVDTLLKDVWGPGPSSSRNVVEAQISRLRSKLRGTEAEGAIITVSGVGYLIR
ncbi:MAG: hypothetical protein GEU80_16860 [Dehalococcoidia bacterium]|nr:hypothetical protein [Dehalococcoidia bacterium]